MSCRSLPGRWRGLVDGGEGVEGAGVADEGQQDGNDADQVPATVADVEVARDVPPDL